jgi:molybdopterin biosynthesis enzyme MoaB
MVRCAAVSKGGKKAVFSDGPLKVGLIFLSPEGWKVEREVSADLSAIWAGAGKLELHSLRLDPDPKKLEKALKKWTGRGGMAVICVIGKSGHRPGDFAPEVTRGLLHRDLPGIEERMYLASPRRPEEMLFRGAAGIRRETMIVNLPPRPARVRQILRFIAPVLRHALDKIAGDESECAR